MTENDMITAIRSYGPRSYEQDITIAWDQLLAHVRNPPPSAPEPATTAPTPPEHPSLTGTSAIPQ